MGSITMRRLMGLEKRRPHKVTVDIEEEFYQVISQRKLRLTTVVNHGVEDYLRSQGLIKSEE